MSIEIKSQFKYNLDNKTLLNVKDTTFYLKDNNFY